MTEDRRNTVITWPARQRVAAVAVMAAAITAIAFAALGGTPAHAIGALVYVTSAALALVHPPAIVAQVLGGQLLVANVLLREDAPSPLLLAVLLASVVATAELLGLTSRLRTPHARDLRNDLKQVVAAGVLAGAIFQGVSFLGGVVAPIGLFAVALACAACVLLASSFARFSD